MKCAGSLASLFLFCGLVLAYPSGLFAGDLLYRFLVKSAPPDNYFDGNDRFVGGRAVNNLGQDLSINCKDSFSRRTAAQLSFSLSDGYQKISKNISITNTDCQELGRFLFRGVPIDRRDYETTIIIDLNRGAYRGIELRPVQAPPPKKVKSLFSNP